jgi:hypothetical protein
VTGARSPAASIIPPAISADAIAAANVQFCRRGEASVRGSVGEARGQMPSRNGGPLRRMNLMAAAVGDGSLKMT